MEESTTPVWQFVSTYWVEIIVFAWLALLTAALQMNVNLRSYMHKVESDLREYDKKKLESQINGLRNNDIASIKWRLDRLEGKQR